MFARSCISHCDHRKVVVSHWNVIQYGQGSSSLVWKTQRSNVREMITQITAPHAKATT